MKSSHLFSVIATAVLFTGSILAQPGNRQNREKGDFGKGVRSEIPNLNDDQKARIKELRLTFYKETQPLRNQLGELKAKQRTLTTADKADMKAINANIDEITKIQNQLMKKSVAMQQQFRSLLNEEQKMWYDSRSLRKGQQRGMEHKRGFQHQQVRMQNCRSTGSEV